jgi:beta-glucosidase
MTESEGYDRTFQLPAGQDDLIAAVRAANKKVVVAITSGGGVDMTGFVDRVPAILETWYAGEEAGTALAEALFGDFSPSGKLPVTFERRFEDSAVRDSYAPKADKKVVYSEGVFLGYRHFDQTGRKPLFPFGYGLSYTRFKYGALTTCAMSARVGGRRSRRSTWPITTPRCRGRPRSSRDFRRSTSGRARPNASRSPSIAGRCLSST